MFASFNPLTLRRITFSLTRSGRHLYQTQTLIDVFCVPILLSAFPPRKGTTSVRDCSKLRYHSDQYRVGLFGPFNLGINERMILSKIPLCAIIMSIHNKTVKNQTAKKFLNSV